MPQLLVRNLDKEIVHELKVRAARHGLSAEAEHREILRQALLPKPRRSLKDLLWPCLTSVRTPADIPIDEICQFGWRFAKEEPIWMKPYRRALQENRGMISEIITAEHFGALRWYDD